MTQDSAPEHQQDAGEEEWEVWSYPPEDENRAANWVVRLKGSHHVIAWIPESAYYSRSPSGWADQILADHAAARRDRKLEEALRDLQKRIPRVNGAQTRDLDRWHEIIADALLKPNI